MLPLIPRRIRYVAAAVAGYILWAVSPAMRNKVRANLAHIPELAQHSQKLRVAERKAFVELLLNYADLFAPMKLDNPELPKRFPILGKEILDTALAAQKGVILVTFHHSAFEQAKYVMRQLCDCPIVTPVEPFAPTEAFLLVNGERARCGIQFLPFNDPETLRAMLKTLRIGGAVLLAIDRDIGGTGIEAELFGCKTNIPAGVIHLARTSGAPIVLLRGFRKNFFSYEGRIISVSQSVAPQTKSPEAVRQALQPIIQCMEKEIAKAPEQWVAVFADQLFQTEQPLGMQR